MRRAFYGGIVAIDWLIQVCRMVKGARRRLCGLVLLVELHLGGRLSSMGSAVLVRLTKLELSNQQRPRGHKTRQGSRRNRTSKSAAKERSDKSEDLSGWPSAYISSPIRFPPRRFLSSKVTHSVTFFLSCARPRRDDSHPGQGR